MSNVLTDIKNAALMHLLHAMFVPTSRKVTKDEHGKKNLIKHSIKDSQDGLMVFGASVEAMQAHITKLQSHGDPIQPYILVVGTIFQQKEILVYFDSVMYKIHSIVRGIEVCYKIFHLFNLEYLSQSSIVWKLFKNIFLSFLQNMINLIINYPKYYQN